MRKALTHSPQVALDWVRSARTPPDNLIIPRSFGHGPGCWTFNCAKNAQKVAKLNALAVQLTIEAGGHWDPGAQLELMVQAADARKEAAELQAKIDQCCS